MDQMNMHGVVVEHHFLDGLYIKQIDLPAGVMFGKHSHTYDHYSILAKGDITLYVDGKPTELSAPQCILIKANQAHAVRANTPVTWFCAHATSDTDATTVDASILAKVTA